MNKRQLKRYLISSGKNADKGLPLVINDTITGYVNDLSQGGVGFEIKGNDKGDFDFLFEKNDFFIKFFINQDEIITGIRLSWHIFKEEKSQTAMIGGGPFSLMSKEDNLKIFNYLQDID